MANERQLLVRIVGDSGSLERAFGRSSKSGQHFALTMRGVTRSTGGFARGFASGAGALSSFGGALALTSGSFFAGAGIVAGLKASVTAAGDFQRTLNVLQSVSGATTKQMRDVSREATRLGADLSLPATSAVDAANAMTQLVKGGLSVAQALDAARGTLQLSAAAQTDVGTAATITARTLSAFALAGGQAGTVADALANAANAATGDITDFAVALQQSATVAHQFGLSAAETVTVLAELAKAGLVGSDAGTSLRVMLSRLLPTSVAAKKEMAHLGISVQDASGHFLGIRQIIDEYSRALAKLTPAERQHALQTIFGTDAQRAANIILGDGVKNYDNLRAAVGRQGAAAKLAAAQQKGFKGALDGFNSALQTTEVNLGTTLLPALTRYLKQSGKWLSDTHNQKRLQQDLNTILHDGSVILGGLKSIVEGVDRVTGGFKQTLELLVGIKLAPKVLGWLGSFNRLIGAEGVGLAGAASKSGLLLTRLRALAKIGTITIVLSLIPKAKGNENQNAPSNNPVAKFFAGLPIVGNAFSQVNRLTDKLAEAEGLTEKVGKKSKGITAARAALTQTFEQASLLNPKLTRKAFDLGQSIARAFLKGQADGVTKGSTSTAKVKADQVAALAKLAPKGITAAQRNTFFDNALTRQLGRVQDLGLKGQLAALGRISVLISKRIAATKDITRKLSLEDKLLEVSRQAKSVRSELASQIVDARAARQFKALGLDATGSPLVPAQKALKRELGTVSQAIAGTFLDTSKTQSVLSKIRRVLGGGLGALSKDVRATVKRMLDDLDQQLKDHKGGPETKFQKADTSKLLAGLGLDPAQFRAVRARLSQVGAGGTVPRGSAGAPALAGAGGARTLVNHTHVYIDGKEIAPTVTRHQQKASRRNPGQRRGPHAGQ